MIQRREVVRVFTGWWATWQQSKLPWQLVLGFDELIFSVNGPFCLQFKINIWCTLLTDFKLPCDTWVHVPSLCLTLFVNKGTTSFGSTISYVTVRKCLRCVRISNLVIILPNGAIILTYIWYHYTQNYAGIIRQGLTCVEGSDILNVPVNVDDEYWVAGLTVYWKLDLKCLSDLLLPTLTTMVYVYSASACLSLETSVSCWVQPHRIEVFPFYLLHGLSLQIPFSYILPTFEILATWKVIWYLLWHHMKSCL